MSTLPALSPWGLEVANGLLAWLFAYQAAFIVAFLAHKWQVARWSFRRNKSKWKQIVQTTKLIYFDQKPAVAIMTTAVGMHMMCFAKWFARWASNHGLRVTHWADWIISIEHWIGVVVIITGMVCWARVISPFRHTNLMWFLMMAFAFGTVLWMSGSPPG